MDDEEAVAQFQGGALERLGYDVAVFSDCTEAWEEFRSRPAEFDLVITDMTMPRMTGAELSVRILGLRPDMPIVLCTGFSDLMNAEKAKGLGIRAFVMKPISIGRLARTIRGALGDS